MRQTAHLKPIVEMQGDRFSHSETATHLIGDIGWAASLISQGALGYRLSQPGKCVRI
jgi:hypothetical protein